MPRVKRGTTHVAKRKKLLSRAKGYKWGRKKLIRLASTAVTLAGAHAFRDRRRKKRENRALWNVRISAAVKQHGLNYSQFIHLLKQANIELDRKVLSQIAAEQPKLFEAIVAQVKK